jgi:hypothetical protein
MASREAAPQAAEGRAAFRKAPKAPPHAKRSVIA